MGGLHETYEKTVKLTARLLPEAITKMDKYIAEPSIKDFTIEVHGMKGVLRSIGAVKLGSEAANLENAAIGDDMDFCVKNYPPFREALTSFSAKLDQALESDENAKHEKIDKEKLSAALLDAKAAAESYDAVGAAEILAPIANFSYNKEADELLKNIIFALEEFNCESALSTIKKMEEIL
jgi:HPt (histidine-containing phosphotransfer) domain-containing protein